MALLFSIVVPLLLGCLQFFKQGPKAISHHFHKSGFLKKLAMILLLPFYPIYYKIQEVLLKEASKDYNISLDSLQESIYWNAQFIQVEIGLESHLQLIISITLLLLANSETHTIPGLEVLFEKETFFYLNAKLALTLSITLSLVSCIKSHIKGISKQRQHSTALATVIISVYTSVSIALRVFCCVLYLTPAFGLFNSLRHLQGEMYPYHQPFYEKVINLNESFFFGNAPPIPWSKITRWKYVGYTIAEPPEATLYTYYTIDTYFNVLVIAFAVNIYLQWAMKKVTNPEVFRSLSFIESMIHAISCCFIPYPMKEWDEQKGNVPMHQQRKKKVLREMLASIMLNFTVNILLLSPLIILGT